MACQLQSSTFCGWCVILTAHIVFLSHTFGQLSIIIFHRSLFCINVLRERFILTSGHSTICRKLYVRNLEQPHAAFVVSGHLLLGFTVHPAIGDAIDEDGSGYLSVTEVDQFFEKKPKEWSSAEWIA